MKSIAVYYEPNDGEQGDAPNLDIHINHWKLKKNSRLFAATEYFLDFGLKISSGRSINSLCLYLPCSVEKVNELIEDLGCKLKSQEMLAAVFNEAYTFSTINAAKAFSVKNGDDVVFNVYELDVKNDVTANAVYSGTVIKIKFTCYENVPTYYRFRLKSRFVRKLSYIYRPKNSFLESIFSSVEVVDFRINDTRNLNSSFLEHLNSGRFKFNIHLVHYFSIRNVTDEFIISNQKINSVRQLESYIWNAYMDSSKHKYDKSFAYHLKRKVTSEEIGRGKYIDEFAAVIKFKFEDRKMLSYVSYIVIFAILSGILGNFFYDLFRDSLFNGFDHISCKLIEFWEKFF